MAYCYKHKIFKMTRGDYFDWDTCWTSHSSVHRMTRNPAVVSRFAWVNGSGEIRFDKRKWSRPPDIERLMNAGRHGLVFGWQGPWQALAACLYKPTIRSPPKFARPKMSEWTPQMRSISTGWLTENVCGCVASPVAGVVTLLVRGVGPISIVCVLRRMSDNILRIRVLFPCGRLTSQVDR